jgi:hypothetical protein
VAEERRIRTVFEVVGAESAAETVERLADAFTETERAEVAAQAVSRFEEAIASAQTESARFASGQLGAASATGEFGDLARESTQQAIQFTQKLAAAAGAVQGLAANIGLEGQAAGLVGRVAALTASGAELGGMFGPQGAIVGGIAGLATATIPQLIEALFGVPPAQEAVEESTRSATDALDAQATAARNARQELQEFLAAASTAGRRRAAQEGAEAVRALIEERDRLMGSGRAIDRLDAMDVEDRIRRLQADVQSDLDEIESEEGQLRRAAAARSGGGGRTRAGEKKLAEEQAFIRLLDEEIAQYDRLSRAAAEAEAANEAMNRERVEQARFAIESEEQLRREQHERELERMRETQAANEALVEANREAYERSREETKDTASLVDAASRGMVRAFSEIASGSKTAEEAFKGLLAGFLESIAEQALTKAAFEYAEGIAAFARYDIAGGAQHIAAGVAFTGVAIATGAAAGALSAPPQGGQQADRPDRTRDTGDGGGKTVFVNNWNAPTVAAGTEADVGRTFDRFGRAAARRFGRLAA